MHSILTREGYRVDHTLPGVPAIRHLLANEPDLVILSINRPDGEWKFCRTKH